MNCPIKFDPESNIWSNEVPKGYENLCLGQKIFNQLDQWSPEKIIEINYDNDKKLTAAQLKSLMINFAANLTKLGIQKGDVVVFVTTMNSLTTPLIYACYLIGAVVSPMDVLFSDDDFQYTLALLNPTLIVHDGVFHERVNVAVKIVNLTNLKLTLSFDESGNHGKSVLDVLFSKDNSYMDFKVPDLDDPDNLLAGLVLSSGSTGRPKAIMISHSLISLFVNTWWPVDSSNVIYVASPFRWISQFTSILQPISSEAIRIFTGQKTTVELCSDLIRKYQVTNFFAVTGLITNILNYVQTSQGDHLRSIKIVLSSGERISERISDAVSELIPESTFLRAYGMTELAGCIGTDEKILSKTGGYYINPGLSLRIIDEMGNNLGPNQNGKILLKAIPKFLKYWKNEEADKSAYIDNGWFITGDYGKVDKERQLHVYNRVIDLIKCCGKILIPSIVEKIMDNHPALEVNHIVKILDDGNIMKEIGVAFSVLKSTYTATDKTDDSLKEDVTNFVLKNLPDDQIPPKEIYFIDEFPLHSNGKVDKLKLKNWAIANMVKK